MRTAIRSLLPVLLLSTSTAHATPNFPDAVRRILGAVQSPPCSVCHAGGQTGRGTVTTPFGQAMRDRGLVAYDETSLQTALTRMETDKVDSNGDGVPDVDELRAGKDPNLTGSAPELQYGCGVTAGRGHPWTAAPLGLAALVRSLLRRRRLGR
jgi:hypothetical protein